MPFSFQETKLKEVILVKPTVITDSRGYFFESYLDIPFNDNNIKVKFIQDNQSKSSKNTIRGLHYQKNPKPQAKLVRCVLGAIYDVAVDIRPASPTFGQHVGVILDSEKNEQLFIPEGFAHGFSVLSQEAIVCYKCSNYYAKELEAGILYNDPHLNIDWKIEGSPIVSDKDLKQNSLEQTFERAFYV